MTYPHRAVCSAILALLFANAVAADELVVYSGREDKFVQPLLDAFTQQTRIPVTLKTGNSSTLLTNLSLEGSSTKADLYIGSDVGNLQRGGDFGLFMELPDSILHSVPREHRSPHDDWVGLSGRLRVLVVNTNSPVGSKLDSVFGLADPRLKGKIAITETDNESFIGGVTSYMHLVGKKQNRTWLKSLKDNADGKFFGKHSEVVKAVAAGEREAGLVNHYYALRHISKNPDDPIRIVIPDQASGQIGAAWNMTGIAMSRYTRNVAAAEKLVAFLVSAQGQKVFAEVNQEYPTRPGIPLAKGVPQISNVRLTQTPMEEIGRQREATIAEIQRLGLL